MQLSAIGTLIDRMQARFERRVLLVARASTAISLILEALAQPDAYALCPATACPAVAYAIESAGWHPLFVDTDMGSLNASFDLVQLPPSRVKAVVLVHAFGRQHKHSKELRRWCDRQGVTLIEDICQFGGSQDFQPVGHFVIDSFGATKLIDCGWGGVVWTEDASFIEILSKQYTRLPIKPSRQDAAAYRDAYYSLWHAHQKDFKVRRMMPSLGRQFISCFIHQAEIDDQHATEILRSCDQRDELISMRRRKAELYFTGLKDLPIQSLPFNHSDVPWRYSILTRSADEQTRVTQTLRDSNLDASNWYPSLSLDWTQNNAYCPDAEQVERRIVNLWLDEHTSLERVQRTIDVLQRFYNNEHDHSD